MAIYIVRHGETAGNADGIIQFPHTPLNERGLAQAAAVASRLAEHGITRILSSDYARALITARHLQRGTGAELEVVEELRERNFGELRGRPRSEVGTLMHAEDFAPPGGESWPVFHERVARAWQHVTEAAKASESDLAIVTHGLVCFSLVSRQLTLPAGTEPIRGFGNTSVTVVEAAAPWRVRLLNCCAHLDAGIEARGSVL